MAQVLVKNLDEQVVRSLKERATLQGRSLEEELRFILTQAAEPDYAELRSQVAALREKTASRQKTDSLILLREDRDR